MADGSSNAFLEAVRTAVAQQWCMKPYCTTCGAMKYRSALRRIGGKGPLADALATMDVDELMSLPHWDDAVEIAVVDLGRLHATALLGTWLEHADQNLRFLDFVLFTLVGKLLPVDHPLRAQWESKALTVVAHTRDFSLTESLVLALRGRALAHDHLIEIARSFAVGSPQMRRVLRNACNIEVDAGN